MKIKSIEFITSVWYNNKERDLSKAFGIGYKGKIPWHLPKELQFFQGLTKQISGKHPKGIHGSPIIMGRKKFESLRGKKALPGRTNIILTDNSNWEPKNQSELIQVTSCPLKALAIAQQCPGDSILIIGGEEVYRSYAEAMKIRKLHISFITAPHIDCNAFFPMDLFDLSNKYNITFQEVHPADDRNIYGFTSRTYELI